ncbi:MAG: cell wall hydrolase/autolysin [Candidatus Parvibacillus calidus]|nr:MAG: cell wall hydrolase/autolysin [Candidatus Parvibacillus calidus]WKZ63992.1 MAG: N-acetylmuramoyl-L-alanine amidase [Saprospiraceae bacterium]
MSSLRFSFKGTVKLMVTMFAILSFPFLSKADCPHHNEVHACTHSKGITNYGFTSTGMSVLKFSKNLSQSDLESIINLLPEGHRQYKIRTIVLDAGHGGKDGGCLGKDSREKNLTLEYVLALGAKIEKAYPDINVIYTRKTDEFIELHERANIANRAKADLFISIHCNWNPNSNPYGTETYVLGLHRAKDNLEVAKRENSSIFLENDYQKNYDGFDPNSPEGNILLSMSQNAHLTQSISIAEKIEHEFENTSGRKSRGVRQAGFLVLRATSMPAILIETGFLSNVNEESYMTSSKGKKEIVDNIFRGFERYKSNVEFSSGGEEKILADNSGNKNKKQEEGVIESQKKVVVNETTNPVASDKTKDLSIINNLVDTNNDNNPEKVEICVQLEVTKTIQDLSLAKWSPFSNIITRSENNLLKYQVVCTSIEEARSVKQVAKNQGFPQAFICAYRDGERISLEEINEHKIGLR